MNREAALLELTTAEESLASASAAITRLRALLDVPATAVVPSPPLPLAEGGLTRPEAFFAAMRALLGGSLTETQVEGLNAILTACRDLPVSWTAYVVATACHETNRRFSTDSVESLNYSVEGLLKTFSRARISEADARRFGRTSTRVADQVAIGNAVYGGEWGKANLGNTQPGDGWKFRGHAWPHCTGRRNFQKADDALGLGGALVANPELSARLEVCAGLTIKGMVEGWFTGVSLNNRLPAVADLRQFTKARHVINGNDRAEDIAVIAMAVQSGLQAGGWR